MKPTLDRRKVLPTLFPNPDAFYFVSGLAGSARDLAALTDDGTNSFCMGGVMGSACTIGLGMAVGAPSQNFVVVTGDGELQMNIGSLTTIANSAPDNLTIICMDNEHHGETGNQAGHTSRNVDLESVGRSVGFKTTLTVRNMEHLSEAVQLIEGQPGPRFFVIKIKNTEPSAYKRLMDPAAVRYRFKSAFERSKKGTA